jgi:hypothetical protein
MELAPDPRDVDETAVQYSLYLAPKYPQYLNIDIV